MIVENVNHCDYSPQLSKCCIRFYIKDDKFTNYILHESDEIHAGTATYILDSVYISEFSVMDLVLYLYYDSS